MISADGLKKYYLIKCFEKPEYRKSFNEGSNIHISAMQEFFDLEAKFQRDTEGLICEQTPDTTGWLFSAPPNMRDLLRNNGCLLDNGANIVIPDNCSQESFVDCFLQNAQPIGLTKSMRLSLCGYICCFYLVAKESIQFHQNEIAFRTDSDRANFFEFLFKYTEEKNAAYISVYDAFPFVQTFYDGMEKRKYNISFAPVQYEVLSMTKRIEWFLSNQFEKLVFTKDEEFAYQKEFRIFLTKPQQNEQKFIEESGIDFQQTIIKEFVYLSPAYSKKLMENNS